MKESYGWWSVVRKLNKMPVDIDCMIGERLQRLGVRSTLWQSRSLVCVMKTYEKETPRRPIPLWRGIRRSSEVFGDVIVTQIVNLAALPYSLDRSGPSLTSVYSHSLRTSPHHMYRMRPANPDVLSTSHTSLFLSITHHFKAHQGSP